MGTSLKILRENGNVPKSLPGEDHTGREVLHCLKLGECLGLTLRLLEDRHIQADRRIKPVNCPRRCRTGRRRPCFAESGGSGEDASGGQGES